MSTNDKRFRPWQPTQNTYVDITSSTQQFLSFQLSVVTQALKLHRPAQWATYWTGISLLLSHLLPLILSYSRSQWPRGLKRSLLPLACYDSGFESRRVHGCLSVACVVCCQVEVSATSWLLVQRSPTDCGASCVIKKPRGRGGHSPRWAAEPEKIIIIINSNNIVIHLYFTAQKS
jgi:hypothetical protein